VRRGLIAATGVVAVLASVAACGSGDGAQSGAGGEGQTLTVWVMDGSAPPQWQKDVKAAFEKKTGARMTFAVQQWNGIQQKITTALSESDPPDVLEVGNTQTPAYARTGGLADLAGLKESVGGDWTKSMNRSAVYGGKQYAAPWYAVNRTVVYNKRIWAQAGIKSTPKTREEFFVDLAAIKSKTSAEPLYLPGQNWYFFDGLLIGKKVGLVKKQGGRWVSNLADPRVGEVMKVYKKYDSYSAAPKDKDEATPQQATVFAKGKTGAFIGLGYEGQTAIRTNPKLKKDIGYFTIPGEHAGKPEGVFLGGSNLAVAAGSQKQQLAKEFLKIALSDKYEGELAAKGGVIPNKASLETRLKGNPSAEAAAPAVAGGGMTPLIPQWAAVENPPNPIKNYMTAVLKGTSHAAAARSVNGELNKRLSQKQ
jgi:N,N'-diacetylchitobiose transport system substrate-binding protein